MIGTIPRFKEISLKTRREIEESILPSHNIDDLKQFNGSFENLSPTNDENGYSSMHYAIAQGDIEAVKYLVEKNWNIDYPTSNDTKDTTIHLSIDSGNVMMLHYLVTNGVDPNQCNLAGQNGLIYAAFKNKLLHVSYLLHIKNITKNAQDEDGNTALHHAVKNGNIIIVKELLKHNVNVKKANREGMTPLHIAAKTRNSYIAQLLLENDISLFNITDNYRKTAYDYALEDQDSKTIEIFKKFKAIYRFPKVIRRFYYHFVIFAIMSSLYLIFRYMPIYIEVIALVLFFKYFYTLFSSEDFQIEKNPSIKLLVDAWYLICVANTFIYVIPNYKNIFIPIQFTMIFIVFLYLFYRASKSDPGYISQRQSDILELYSHLKSHSPDSNTQFCYYCLIKRPERSKHCYACRRCVEVMDHHCPWTNNCIGEKNMLWFYLAIISAVLLMTFHFFISFFYFSKHEAIMKTSGFLSKTWKIREIAPTFLEIWIGVIMLNIFCIILMIHHTYLIGFNVTRSEMRNWWRMPNMVDSSGDFHNPYDKGFLNNFNQMIKNGLNRQKEVSTLV